MYILAGKKSSILEDNLLQNNNPLRRSGLSLLKRECYSKFISVLGGKKFEQHFSSHLHPKIPSSSEKIRQMLHNKCPLEILKSNNYVLDYY